MVYPRQKLYSPNHIGYIKQFFSKSPDKDTEDFDKAFEAVTTLKGAIPLAMGRIGLHLGLKYALKKGRQKVLMSPFTIFDVINMVITADGSPLFCDSESPYSPHINLDNLKQNVDEEVGAVIITHYHSVNPHIEEIADWCAKNEIVLIEDCAINLGGFIDDKPVGGFGDISIFSFGLFKFVSAYCGGAVYIKDDKLKDQINQELNAWDKMRLKELKSYVIKGIKLSVLTSHYLFNCFTFPLFKFGYLNDIAFIKNQSKNDPDPHLKNEFPSVYKRRPSDFQVSEFIKKLSNVLPDKKKAFGQC